jgi:hypothetical protein
MSKSNSTKVVNLSDNLKRLSNISSWFDEQKEVDVEEGLRKIKEAAVLIKESRGRLAKIENEFEEIKKDIEIEVEDKNSEDEVTGEDSNSTNSGGITL